MQKVKDFVGSDKFSSFLSIASMLSKYVIALLILVISWKWEYTIPFAISIVASFALGLTFRAVLPRLTWLVKYVVTIGELSFLQIHSQAVTKSLLLVIVFSTPLVLLITYEIAHKFGKSHLKPFKLIGIVADKLYGFERVLKLTLGAYLSIVFGLQDLINEAVILWSFGLIGSVEVDHKVVYVKVTDVVSKLSKFRIKVYWEE